MKILDLSAGSRSIWFNRLHPEAVYVDERESMRPTVVADTLHLPFASGTFDVAVFDPPHVTNGKTSTMARYYGSMEAEEIKNLVWRTSVEAYRVTTDAAVMALKWNDHDVKLERVLRLMEGWEPLFGQRVAGRTKHRSGTYWVLLKKRVPGMETVHNAQMFLKEIDHDQ